jgi:hypothetical protein
VDLNKEAYFGEARNAYGNFVRKPLWKVEEVGFSHEHVYYRNPLQAWKMLCTA